MILQDILQRRVSNPPTTSTERRTLLAAFFDVANDGKELGGQEDRFAAYFTSWYEDQCGDLAGPLLDITIGHMLSIIVLIRNRNETRENIRTKALQFLPAQLKMDEVDLVITLAARLWSITYIDGKKPPYLTGENIDWPANSLQETLDTYFKLTPSPSGKGQLPSFFTAEKLDRIAGIQIFWTANLLDHLKMTNDDKTVYLFHQVSFLAIHNSLKEDVLPPDLVKETIRTLSLLLPGSTKAPNKWYQKKRKGREEELDPYAGAQGHLNASQRRLKEFKYWGERLETLKQVFDQSEPPSMWHWWRDDRKKVQWYTFWIAALVLLLTIVFGFLQSVSSIIQAVLAVKASHGQ